MFFPSTVFLFLFLPALLVLYYSPASNRKRKNAILLLFSIGFYAWGEPLFIFLMLFAIIINWFIGVQMGNSASGKKAWLVGAITFDILLIGVFKYVSFLSRNLAALTGNDKLIVDIALPIGISFFTFQLMSYAFDIYYGSVKAQKNPLYVALYISLFPQLIAGPIVRYQQIEHQITDRQESFSEFTEGMRRFIYGLGKKVLLANFTAQVADNIFDYMDAPSVMTAWLGAIAYTLQIYFDFSGYSDMAIGLGRMFGFHFLENFNYPYIADSVTDFWHRWHISLSTWFRDYVYIPLGGNRVKKSRWILNLFVVWLLTGIWHGANFTFVLWGIIYFCILLLEKQTNFVDKLGGVGRHVYTLLIVTIAWVLFRSADIASGFRYIGYMFGIGANSFLDEAFVETVKGTYVIFLLAFVGMTPLPNKAFCHLEEKGHTAFEWIWLLTVFLISAFEVVSATYNPFIYFNF
ncbi:MAG: MBOAT family protein [Ruminococcaceae bacterium]|nr:MBOAT family protein [Oscillospiraceae bacterium]